MLGKCRNMQPPMATVRSIFHPIVAKLSSNTISVVQNVQYSNRTKYTDITDILPFSKFMRTYLAATLFAVSPLLGLLFADKIFCPVFTDL